MNAATRMVVLALLAGCSSTPSPTFTQTDAAADGAADAPSDIGMDSVATMDASDASDAMTTVVDVPVFDIQAIDAPPPPTDIGNDLPPLPDVQPDTGPMTVDQCYITDPAAAAAVPGGTGPAVSVAVFVAGVTPGIGEGAGVEVQVGTGAGASDPLSSATWTWVAGAYGSDIDGSGPTGALDFDRYTGVAPVPSTAGEWAYAGRARIHGGPWTACDLVSSTPHSYDPSFEGMLVVAAASAPVIGYCNIQNPQTLSAMAGMAADSVVYSRVYVEGVTDQGCTNMPTTFALQGELGFGEMGSYPSDATWTWTMAAYADHRDSTSPLIEGDCHDIEYTATPTAPATCGMYAYGFRYREGNGPWSYCRWAPPATGAPVTPAWNVWVPSLAGTMTVAGCM